MVLQSSSQESAQTARESVFKHKLLMTQEPVLMN